MGLEVAQDVCSSKENLMLRLCSNMRLTVTATPALGTHSLPLSLNPVSALHFDVERVCGCFKIEPA